MRPRLRIIFLFGIIFTLIQSCSGNSENLVEEKNFVTVVKDTMLGSWNLLRQDSIPLNTMLILEGYIGDPGEQITQSGSYITLPFFERRNQRSGFGLMLQFQAGELRNQMKELPTQFSPNDIQIFCETGDTAHVGSFVRITAFDETVSGVRNWRVNLVEQGDFISDQPDFDKAQPLTSEIIFDSTVNEYYSYIDGKLELPTLILPYTNGIRLNLTNGSVGEFKDLEIPIGEGPGTMNDLPDNFTESDLIVRDVNGKNILYKKKVRMYGNWTRFNYSSTFPGEFLVEEIEVISN